MLVKRIPTNLIHDVFKFVRGVIKLAPASRWACMDLTHLLLIWTMYWSYICQNRNPYDQVNYDQVRRPSVVFSMAWGIGGHSTAVRSKVSYPTLFFPWQE